jgi:hypothetical protein
LKRSIPNVVADGTQELVANKVLQRNQRRERQHDFLVGAVQHRTTIFPISYASMVLPALATKAKRQTDR